MKKLTSLLSAVIMMSAFVFTGCESDDEAKPDVKPVTVFNASIDGQPFNSQVLLGRYYPEYQLIDIEGHEVDSTVTDQYVIGLQIAYDQFNDTGNYDFAEHGAVGDVIFYMFSTDGKSYHPTEGMLTINKINTTEFEATFSSLKLKSGYPDTPTLTLTDGTIRVDLVETFD